MWKSVIPTPGGSGRTRQKLRNHHPLMGGWEKDPTEMAEAGDLLREGQGHSCPSNALGEPLPLSLALHGNWSSRVCHRSAVRLRHHFSPLNLMVPIQKRGASSPRHLGGQML